MALNHSDLHTSINNMKQNATFHKKKTFHNLQLPTLTDILISFKLTDVPIKVKYFKTQSLKIVEG